MRQRVHHVFRLSAIAVAAMLAHSSWAKVEDVSLRYARSDGPTPATSVERGNLKPGQRIATGAAEVREVVFSDGTVLVLGPNSDALIENLESSDSGLQRLGLRLNQGLVRITGGASNEQRPILLTTPSAQLALLAASAVIEVSPNGDTRANLLSGRELAMTSGGQTERILRPGHELSALRTGGAPAGPAQQAEGVAGGDALALGTGQLTRQADSSEAAVAGATPGNIATANVRVAALLNDSISGNIPRSGNVQFVEIDSLAGALGSDGFGPGAPLGNLSLATDQPSNTTDLFRSATQNRDPSVQVTTRARGQDGIREAGSTTNRVFRSEQPFTQIIGTNAGQIPVKVMDGQDSDPLQYVFIQSQLALDAIGDESVTSWYRDEGCCSGSVSAPFILGNTPGLLGADGTVTTHAEVTQNTFTSTGGYARGSVFRTADYRVLQAGFAFNPAVPDGIDPTSSRQSVSRRPDNFLLVEARPRRATEIERDRLRRDFTVDQAVDPSSNFQERLNVFLSLTDDQLRQLAQRILIAGDVELLRDSDLADLGFLSPDDRATILRRVNAITSSVSDPTLPERFIFAAGNVNAGRIDENGKATTTFQNQFAVDRFFVSAGLENFEQKDSGRTVATGIRAFLRNETSVGVPLSDSGVWVVNTGSSASAAQNALAHVDFGMATVGDKQHSTMSVTIGEVRYEIRTCASCDLTDSVEVVVDGRTVASSRGDGVSTTYGTVSTNSALFSTAAGGGNPALQRSGYAGYLVLENFDADTAPNGGVEHALGRATTEDQRHAVLRLATATGQPALGTRTASVLNGWVGGLAERENGAGAPLTILPIGSGTEPTNVRLQTDPETNRVQADIVLNNQLPLTLGGLSSGPSAFIDDDRFAAGNDKVAMVTANLLRDGQGNLPASLNLPDGSSIPQYRHVQWGFFLGDIAGTAGSDLVHVHMGTWAAGRMADPSQLPTSGTASYSGHAIGNVANNGALYTAVGSFQNTWNFAQRAGTVNMNFDQAQYTGVTQLRSGSAVFVGNLTAPSRTGSLIGNFVQPAAGGTAGTPPVGVVGRFGISESAGTPYRASGTFAAERTP